MATSRPPAHKIREAIEASVDQRPLTIIEIAANLQSSRSQVQRSLAEEGTSFTLELKRVRRLRAFRMLVRERRTVTEAAQAVGVSADYLRVLLLPIAGIPPGELRRAVILVARFERWRNRVPPAFGSVRYWEERKQWAKARAELHRLLAPVPSSSPLRPWVLYAERIAKRPDHRRQPFRRHLRNAREREAREFADRINDVVRRMRTPAGS